MSKKQASEFENFQVTVNLERKLLPDISPLLQSHLLKSVIPKGEFEPRRRHYADVTAWQSLAGWSYCFGSRFIGVRLPQKPISLTPIKKANPS